MIYPFQFIIDTIFPPSAHCLLLRNSSPERFLHWYQPKEVEGIIYLSSYQLPEIKAAVAACKFENNFKAADLLAVLLDKYLSDLPHKNTLLIPIPLSRKRLANRKFNQVERVLRKISKLTYQNSICTNLLIRSIDTKRQTSLKRKERLTNINNAFTILKNNKFYLNNIERIIICDDVTTTGTTIESARKALSPLLSPNVELICLAWAH